jgi:D-galactose 1-dehydrogenase
MPIRTAIIGYGKIARDEHVPAIAGEPRLELAAVVSRNAELPADVPGFRSQTEMLAAMGGAVEAVAICTPPSVRHPIVAEALSAGLHVLIEKPPAATLGEIEDMERLAAEAGRTLFTAWHSQHAPAVAPARRALSGKAVRSLHIQWFEDVRKWHPGQEWVWEPGGFGVFDPGINALSIATRILPTPLFVREAELSFPENRQTPIAARLEFSGRDLRAEMDWRYTQGERWTIRVECEDGTSVELDRGGAELRIGGEPQRLDETREYPALYRRFADLVEGGGSEVDREPLRIVADAMLIGRREQVDPFV